MVLVCSDAGGDQDGVVTLASLERWLSTQVTAHPRVTVVAYVVPAP